MAAGRPPQNVKYRPEKRATEHSFHPPRLRDPVSRQPVLRYHGANFFRQRIVMSTVFYRPIQISDIRVDDTNPGIRKYEAILLRLIDRITDGGSINIDVTGTDLRYKPGIIKCDGDVIHDCGLERNITYYLQALLLIAPFAKKPLDIRLKGITHGNGCSDIIDPSVDYFRAVVIPLMEHIGIREGISINIIKRGVPPLGQGEIQFQCPIVQKIQPFQLLREGRVKRVRGTAFTNHVSPQISVRMIDRARGMLNDFLPDVWIYDSKTRSGLDGPSQAYGIALVAETMKGFFKGTDVVVDEQTQKKIAMLRKKDEDLSNSSMALGNIGIAKLLEREQSNNGGNKVGVIETSINQMNDLSESELIGRLCAQRLLLELHYGGVVDTTFQYLPLLFMAAAEAHEPCKILLGRLTPYSVQFLRHLKDFIGLTFSFEEVAPTDANGENEIDDENEDDEKEENDESPEIKAMPHIIVKCAGIGLKNIGKRTF